MGTTPRLARTPGCSQDIAEPIDHRRPRHERPATRRPFVFQESSGAIIRAASAGEQPRSTSSIRACRSTDSVRANTSAVQASNPAPASCDRRHAITPGESAAGRVVLAFGVMPSFATRTAFSLHKLGLACRRWREPQLDPARVCRSAERSRSASSCAGRGRGLPYRAQSKGCRRDRACGVRCYAETRFRAGRPGCAEISIFVLSAFPRTGATALRRNG